MHQNKIPFEIINFKNSAGFGLIENILSGALLIILVTFSMYFISLRQKTIFNTNLTNAINDEIKRDIEIQYYKNLLNEKIDKIRETCSHVHE